MWFILCPHVVYSLPSCGLFFALMWFILCPHVVYHNCFLSSRTFLNDAITPFGQDLLIIEASQLHSETQHSAFLWTSDQHEAQSST